jgi:hypothetical protein
MARFQKHDLFMSVARGDCEICTLEGARLFYNSLKRMITRQGVGSFRIHIEYEIQVPGPAKVVKL